MSTPAPSAGRLFGVGVGPGDPELLTLKAQRIIAAADVVAYPVAGHGRSVARGIAAPHLPAGAVEVALTYPVTTGTTEHPGGYEGAIVDFYDDSAELLAAHLDAGRDVVVLCEGDPFFYGSYMYLHDRLAHRYRTEVVPGITSFSAAAAGSGTPLVKRDDVLTILPGTLPADVLAARLRSSDAAVVMKLGRTFASVREATERAGVAERALYVERASSDRERSAPLRSVEGEVPYMSLVLVPTSHGSAPSRAEGAGRVSVVGLGPAGPEWLTPEAQSELAAADVLVGYQTYIDRVPARAGQVRHASDNRVEAERARHALQLAAAGAHVAVVSSGDPGIFAMASAVLEQYEAADPALGHVEVRVVPGLSAMQAAASRVGAPLGHDFCVISLSDILKPWPVIERRLAAAGAADMALALYNPASRTRRDQLERAIAVLRGHRDAGTPVVVARAVGAAEESVTVTTLGELDIGSVDMRTLLIIGASTTRVLDGNGRGPLVYTPRSYPG
ncbi:MAG: Precorrin-2 C(20)-methyltransferase / Precorrin-3B C(17)-methyltransferase [uncultured Solirubrobacteraceae bacterium]|uniref:Precorrin-2 C(20)-methyltransferase / Precorrin-3B C(17)-methyltransferase n=1 Tax=uncultured Solirubrobacteraceae bacterium TaxID=1162706 RepID=A0A6J4SH80_9ACTN|nr:MAG: Precorrin-2 C(20)-methyltransferase / Precorrin-3B C(17)-methyltransferase [uncultured Solirubrobacteraceae bacterium]